MLDEIIFITKKYDKVVFTADISQTKQYKKDYLVSSGGTTVVVVVVFLIALFLGIVDALLSKIVQGLI